MNAVRDAMHRRPLLAYVCRRQQFYAKRYILLMIYRPAKQARRKYTNFPAITIMADSFSDAPHIGISISCALGRDSGQWGLYPRAARANIRPTANDEARCKCSGFRLDLMMALMMGACAAHFTLY